MARRMAVLAVLAISQTAGVTAIAATVAVAGGDAPSSGFIPFVFI